MVLVGYSDSEGSDSESGPAPAPAISSKSISTTTAKQPIQKIVDRSNPHKIRVSLPSLTEKAQDENERPAKKPRLGSKGGGLMSDLNSFLPAPKRSGATAPGLGSGEEKPGANGEKKTLGKGKPLGSGISLKTGAAPAFEREPLRGEEADDGFGNDGVVAEKPPLPEEVKIIGKATIFKPLSVAKKTKKKIKNPAAIAVAASTSTAIINPVETISPDSTPKPKPRVSLFSISQETKEEVILPAVEDDTSTEHLDDFASYDQSISHELPQQDTAPASQTQNLSDLASTMNLDAASRRRLLGRHANDSEAIKVLHFDTDAEWAANERLRASGESNQHNPFKAIQPGRHTLRQLVSAAVTQKDALEQKWAEGKAKQGDAANRYGWR